MKGQNVRTFKALSCLAAIFIGSSVLAQDFAGADGGDVVVLRLPISVNVRLKVGPKFFDFTAWEPADDHGMAGCEVEIAWEVLGQSQDQKQTLGLVVGLENSSGSGNVSLGVDRHMEITELDIGLRYTISQQISPDLDTDSARLKFWAGIGWADLSGEDKVTGFPDEDLDGSGIYLEAGIGEEIPFGPGAQSAFFLGVGMKLTFCDLEEESSGSTFSANPFTLMMSVGLKF